MIKLHQFTLVFLVLLICTSSFSQDYSEDLIKKATKIHNKILTIDTHTDTPMWFDNDDYNFGEDNSDKNSSAVDIPRMEKGGLDAVFLAAFIGQGPRNELAYAKAKLRCDNTIESIYTVAKQNKNTSGIAFIGPAIPPSRA